MKKKSLYVCMSVPEPEKHFLRFTIFEFSHEKTWSRMRWKVKKNVLLTLAYEKKFFGPGS